MIEVNTILEEDARLLLSERDAARKQSEILRYQIEKFMSEYWRLHNMEQDVTLLIQKCIGLEVRLGKMFMTVKKLETERDEYKAMSEECEVLQYRFSSLQDSLKEADVENDVLRRHVTDLEFIIAEQENIIKDLKERCCIDTEDKKVSHYIP
jgi:predicted  nucleic acid-binding Zn-ribbon protein